MKKTAYCILLLVGSALPALAQSIVVNNPSTCGIGFNLTDAACDPSVNVVPKPDVVVVNVNNAPGSALGLDVALQEVQLILQHTWTNDLDISLRSPAGIEVPLSFDNGGGDNDYGDVDVAGCGAAARFSMSSCFSVEQAEPPFTAAILRPEGSFFDFNDGSTDPNGFWELVICDDAQGDFGRLEYVNLVFAPASCQAVEEVQVLSVDTTSVQIGWEPDTSCGTTLLEYGPLGFTPGTGQAPGDGTIANVSGCPPFTLSGLQPELTYELYARKICGGDVSANSCPARFTAGCAPPELSLRESFDDLAACAPFCDTECQWDGRWQNAVYNEYDWLVDSAGTATFGTGPAADASGSGNYLYVEASGQNCPSGKTAYLLSDCVQLDKSGTDTCHFSFSYHMFGDGIGQLRVEVSEDGGFTWSAIWQRSGNQGDQWKRAYAGLGDYPDGSVLRLRIVAEEGNSSRGDLAIDELVFHGSQWVPGPEYTYFVDADKDGYGDEQQPIRSCFDQAPAGFAALAGDCNDNDPNINPGQAELPCNGTDENCSGNADENILPPPVVSSDTICSGETVVLSASPNFNKLIFWYGSAEGDDLLGFGNTLVPSVPLVNDGPVPVEYCFYAEESDLTCTSGERAEACILVLPSPNTSVSEVPELCPRDTLDLSSIPIQDAHFTGGDISYHDGFPTSDQNELPSTVVRPEQAETFYYRVTAPFGCFDEGPLELGLKPGPDLNLLPADSIALCEEEEQALSVAASGGQMPYEFLWSTGGMSDNITINAGTQAGQSNFYQLTVTDAAGCFSVDSFEVQTTVSVDSVRRFVSDVSVCEGQDGSITLLPLDGEAPYGFEWKGSSGINGDTTGITDTLVIDGLAQGVYRVSITDSSPEGCVRVIRSIIVNGPGAAVQGIDLQPVSCAGAMDGSICLDVFGNDPQLEWDNGAATACIEGQPGGYYAVTVTDGACVTVLDSLFLPESDELQLAFSGQAPSCSDASDGAIQAEAFGGAPPYSYLWENDINFSDPFGLSAGTYQLTVTDSKGCTIVDSFELMAPDPLELDLVRRGPISCQGASDGSLLVAGQGGTPPYRYDWEGGSNTPLLVNLSPGQYTVTVTDFMGCEASMTYTMEETDSLELQLLTVDNPICVGESDGAIEVEGLGGTPPYSYEWNTGDNGSTLSGLAVGLYEVYLTDANECPADTLAVALDAVSVLDLEIDIDAPPCIGPNNGSISLEPQGTPPFSYDWEAGGSGASLDSVGFGKYLVSITDGQGCIYDTVVTVEAPQVFNASISTVQPACANTADGLINLTVVNATGAPPFTPPLSYEWNDGVEGANRVGVGAGAYVVTVSDAIGCQLISDTIRLEEPPPLQLGLESIGPIACRGDSTGFIEVGVRGGSPPYVYNWVGEEVFTQDIFNIPAGDYRLLVLDNNDCPLDTSFALVEPPALSLEIGVDADDICEGGTVERIFAEVSGGVPPYDLQWSNGSSDSILLSPPSADYTLSVTDANNCQQTTPPLKVKEFREPFRLDTFYAKPNNCFGGSDGCLVAEVSGGSSNYEYHFSNGSITLTDTSSLTICGLAAGNYRVTVTDFTTGCTASSSNKMLTAPEPLTFKRDSVQHVECFGGATGAIFTSADGGNPPYNYIWRDSDDNVISFEEDLQEAEAGTYRVLVYDDKGCTANLTGTILSLNSPIRDTMLNITPVACRGDSSGAIELDVIGGAPPYLYTWSNGQSSLSIDSLPAGIYALTVTDGAGCSRIFPSYTVEQPEAALMLLNDTVQPISCYGTDNGRLEVAFSGGAPPYSYEWKRNGDLLTVMGDSLGGLPAGTYTLDVRDENGCERQYSWVLEEPDSLRASIELSENPAEDSLLAVAVVQGGTMPYYYHWNTEDTTAAISVASGEYALTVTDDNNCSTSVMETVVEASEAAPKLTASLYPNPFRQSLWLELQLLAARPLELLIFRADGQLVSQQSLGLRREVRRAIDVSNLPAGWYYLQVRSRGQILFVGGAVKQL